MQTKSVLIALLVSAVAVTFPLAHPRAAALAVILPDEFSAPAGAERMEKQVADTGRLDYKAYSGTYDLAEHGLFEVSVQEGRLLGELSLRKGLVELFPKLGVADQFFAKDVPAIFAFYRNGQGQVASIVISVAGKGDMKGARKP